MKPADTDPFLALDFAMNERERELYADVVRHYFPLRFGAKPADLIDELTSADAYCGEVEDAYTRITAHPAVPLAGVDPDLARRLIGPAIRLGLILTRFPVPGADVVDLDNLVVDLVLRAAVIDVDAELDKRLRAAAEEAGV